MSNNLIKKGETKMTKHDEMMENYRQLCIDTMECVYNEEGQIMPEFLDKPKTLMDTYARLLDAESKMAAVSAESLDRKISSGTSMATDLIKTVVNTLNLNKVICAEECANKIISSKYMGFINKKP